MKSSPPWQHLAVSDPFFPSHPDRHATAKTLAHDFEMAAASVRGKGHCQDGQERQDWYEGGCIGGKWNYGIVADGAGSAALAATGARLACQTVQRTLRQALPQFDIQEVFPPEEVYTKEALQQTSTALSAILVDAFVAAQDDLLASVPFLQKIFGQTFFSLHKRSIKLPDLSTTLLLFVQREVRTISAHGDGRESLICSLAVGDGMMTAIDKELNVHPLMQPDKGEVANQTEFITARQRLPREELARRVKILLAPCEVIVAMSDGVGDDFSFPVEEEQLLLLTDLCLNGALCADVMCRGNLEKFKAQRVFSSRERDTLRLQAQAPTPALDNFKALLDQFALPMLASERLALHTCLANGSQPSEEVNKELEFGLRHAPSREELWNALWQCLSADGLATLLKPDEAGLISSRKIAHRLNLFPYAFSKYFRMFADKLIARPPRPYPEGKKERADALLKFIDGYQLPASFDDRTLLLFNRRRKP